MSNQSIQTSGENSVATSLKVIAWLTFIGGIILGIIVGNATAEYSWEFNFPFALAAWVSSFISGTLLLGFAEIVTLLQKLVESGSRKLILQTTTENQKSPEQFSDLQKL